MSAYLVGNYHIDCLLTFAKNRDAYLYNDIYKGGLRNADDNTLSMIGQVLTDQNQKSVNDRYKDNEKPVSYEFKSVSDRQLKPIEILKACNCYEYQACESSDYEQTNACKIIRAILKCAIRSLPGYEQADGWDFFEPIKIEISAYKKSDKEA